MLGLVILAIATGYLALAIGVTIAAVRTARTRGVSRAKRVAIGWAVGLVFFLIPFWDWIPTIGAHQYYCANEAKYEVYKSIDQWKRENTEVLSKLSYESRARFSKFGEYERFPLNQRIVVDRKARDVVLTVKREEGQVVDVINEEVLARYVDFRTGYASLGVGGEGAWKFWLKRGSCNDDQAGPGAKFAGLASQWANLGKTRP